MGRMGINAPKLEVEKLRLRDMDPTTHTVHLFATKWQVHGPQMCSEASGEIHGL